MNTIESSEKANKYIVIGVYLGIALVTAGIFLQVRNFDFIIYDDFDYVTTNRNIQSGFNGESIKWAFTEGYANNWHPVTWLSHMLDYQLFGLDAGGHHIVNVLFHIANALLLLTVLKKMTGSLWRSAFVAALFALHPLHVESVAWIAERKDVLSTFFWMLTMLSYVSYVKKPGTSRYVLALCIFAIGLMAKPMLVTLPFVLLLLDYWPLDRLQIKNNPKTVLRLVYEKIPFFVFSAASCLITFFVQRSSGAVSTIEKLPLKFRLITPIAAYAKYILNMVWPKGLAVIYSYIGNKTLMLQTTVTVIFFLLLFALVFYFGRRYRYLITGWLWYFGTLVPVIGIVQVGSQSMADRYTYIPLIGLFIIIAWGLPQILAKWRYRRIVLSSSAAIILVVLSICTYLQLQYWPNSISLFSHAVDVTDENYMAESLLGYSYMVEGEIDKAFEHYYKSLDIYPRNQLCHLELGNLFLGKNNLDNAAESYNKALQLDPNLKEAYRDLAKVYRKQGKVQQAIRKYEQLIEISPEDSNAYYLLGSTLAEQGRFKEAAVYFEKALQLWPNFANAHLNLGRALVNLRKIDEAIEHLEKAIQIDDKLYKAHSILAGIFDAKGQPSEAIAHRRKSIEIKPDQPLILNFLAWALATNPDPAIRQPNEAIAYAEKTCKLTTFKNPLYIDTLAAAHASAGDFTEAIANAEKALQLLDPEKHKRLYDEVTGRLNLFKQGKAYIHE